MKKILCLFLLLLIGTSVATEATLEENSKDSSDVEIQLDDDNATPQAAYDPGDELGDNSDEDDEELE